MDRSQQIAVLRAIGKSSKSLTLEELRLLKRMDFSVPEGQKMITPNDGGGDIKSYGGTD